MNYESKIGKANVVKIEMVINILEYFVKNRTPIKDTCERSMCFVSL